MKKITLIGGDLITKKLLEVLLENEYTIGVYALEHIELDEKHYAKRENIVKFDKIEEAISFSKNIILSMPLMDDRDNLVVTFSSKQINIYELLGKIKNKNIITLRINEKAKEIIEENENKYIDLKESQTYNISNALATAEGVISKAIIDTEESLRGLNVLILGYGRTGKMLAKKFEAMNSNVTCEARKETDLAWIREEGFKAVPLKELKKHLKDKDIIVNTVPYQILKEEEMEEISKDTLIYDITSEPAGIDRHLAKKYRLNSKRLFSLPEKIAPRTMAKTVFEIYKENFEENK